MCMRFRSTSTAQAKEDLVRHYMSRVRDIVGIDVTFNGDATVDATIDVIAQTKIECSSENIAETGGLVTFPGARTEGDCIGENIRSDGKDPANLTIIKNDDGVLTFTSDGYTLRREVSHLGVHEVRAGRADGAGGSGADGRLEDRLPCFLRRSGLGCEPCG